MSRRRHIFAALATAGLLGLILWTPWTISPMVAFVLGAFVLSVAWLGACVIDLAIPEHRARREFRDIDRRSH